MHRRKGQGDLKGKFVIGLDMRGLCEFSCQITGYSYPTLGLLCPKVNLG